MVNKGVSPGMDSTVFQMLRKFQKDIWVDGKWEVWKDQQFEKFIFNDLLGNWSNNSTDLNKPTAVL